MKQGKFKTLLGGLAAFGLIVSAEPSSGSPAGLWQAKDGAKIRIAPCGQNLCGVIAQIKTGGGSRDNNNSDPTKRNRALVGIQVLISMQPNGPSKWSGRVYNDDDGRTYSGNLIELGPSKIKIEGCWLTICDGENLTRVE